MPKTDQEKTKLMNYAKINEQVKRAGQSSGPDGPQEFPQSKFQAPPIIGPWPPAKFEIFRRSHLK